ncbi:MAG: hypothetical protein N2606_00315 [Candidatus Omnitrophica bacterium]|nr:hypothetical protein [Candidatus Omnitrophota bacterium]
MKKTAPDFFYDILPTVNFLLLVCAIFLLVKLLFVIFGTYTPAKINVSSSFIKPPELSESLVVPKQLPIFQEEVFQKKQLFGQTTTNKRKPTQTFVLAGVSVGAKDIAVLKDITNNKSYYCAVGDMIGEFRVKEITKDKVILESANNTLEINR